MKAEIVISDDSLEIEDISFLSEMEDEEQVQKNKSEPINNGGNKSKVIQINLLKELNSEKQPLKCASHVNENEGFICLETFCLKRLTPLCSQCLIEQNHKYHKIYSIADLKKNLVKFYEKHVSSITKQKMELLKVKQQKQLRMQEVMRKLKEFSLKCIKQYKQFRDSLQSQNQKTYKFISQLESMGIKDIVDNVFDGRSVTLQPKLFRYLFDAETELNQIQQNHKNYLDRLTQMENQLSSLLSLDLKNQMNNNHLQTTSQYLQFQKEFCKQLNEGQEDSLSSPYQQKLNIFAITPKMQADFQSITKHQAIVQDIKVIYFDPQSYTIQESQELINQCPNLNCLSLKYFFEADYILNSEQKQYSLCEFVNGLNSTSLRELSIEVFPFQEKQILQVLKMQEQLQKVRIDISVGQGQRVTPFTIKILQQLVYLNQIRHIEILICKFFHFMDKTPSLEAVKLIQKILRNQSDKIEYFAFQGLAAFQVMDPHLYLFNDYVCEKLYTFIFLINRKKCFTSESNKTIFFDNIVRNAPLLKSLELGDAS